MRLVGEGGTVWAEWYAAVSLGSWTLTRTKDQWALEAEIVSQDAFWSLQPLTRVTVQIAGRTWRWQDGSIHVDGDRVYAELPSHPDHL